MTPRRILAFIIILLIGTICSFSSEKPPKSAYKTWINAPPQEQLSREGADDQKNYGRIFLPAMSKSQWEPEVQIYQDDTLVKTEQEMGKSIFLKPGTYTVVFGKGIEKSQKPSRKVTVEREETKVITPNWSGLIVRIINPSRNYIRKNYEIFKVSSKESYGINISKDENEPNQHPDTWLLEPGLYKITKAGATYNTTTNFATVRLLPGHLTQYTIVMNEFTNNFLGAGILEEFETEAIKTTKFTTYSSFNGAINITSHNKSQKDKFSTNINLSTKIDNRFQYDDEEQYFLSEPTFELVMNQSSGQELQINTDNLAVNNIYVRYFVPYFGLYGRLNLESTKLLPGKRYFGNERDEVVKVDNGDTVEVLNDVSEITLSPSFSPLKLREGIGLDFTPLRGSKYRLSFRSGLGLWQNIYNDSYESSETEKNTFKKISSDYNRGLELLVKGDFQPIPRLAWSMRMDVLFPYEEGSEPGYQFENLINYRLLKFLSLEYKLVYSKEATRNYGWIENNLWIRFSYIF